MERCVRKETEYKVFESEPLSEKFHLGIYIDPVPYTSELKVVKIRCGTVRFVFTAP